MTKFSRWLFFLSVLLNVFFVGAYMAHRIPWQKSAEVAPTSVMPYEKLGLSAKQRQVFEEERHRFHSQLLEIQQTIRHKRDLLIRLLSVKNPDRAAIKTQQQEILSLQGRLQDNVISHLLEVSAPLSQPQREHFFALLKKRMASQGPIGPSACD